MLSSATTVVLGLLTLLLSLFPTTRGLGLACAVGVVVAAFFALVVLPAALVSSVAGCSGHASRASARPALADDPVLWRRVGDARRAPARSAYVAATAGRSSRSLPLGAHPGSRPG